MSGRVVIAAVCAVAFLALAAGCSDEEIVLATVPAAKDAGTSVAPRRCIDDSECADTHFCARATCGDPAGTCTLRPFVCEDEPTPVCGCDRITYWNDCLRQAAGVTSMTPRPCDPAIAQTCNGHGDHPMEPGPNERCPDGTFCARLVLTPFTGAPTCPAEVEGTCWSLPPACPQHVSPDRWRRCNGPDVDCTTTCEAIHSEEPHQRASACE